jgi:hypothetical protein
MPKVKKQKAHLNRACQQWSEKRQKTRESEVQNTAVIEQPVPSISGVGSKVQESTASGSGSQIHGNGSSSESDCNFDSEEALLKDPDAMIEEFAADWVASLPRMIFMLFLSSSFTFLRGGYSHRFKKGAPNMTT